MVLQYPNTAVDQWGNTGTWTMVNVPDGGPVEIINKMTYIDLNPVYPKVYNQGWEVRLAGRSYFANSDYTEEAGGEVVSRSR